MRVFLVLIFWCLTNAMANCGGKSTGIPRYYEAVASGVRYLRSQTGKIPERETSLVAYAMIKAGEPKEDQLVRTDSEMHSSGHIRGIRDTITFTSLASMPCRWPRSIQRNIWRAAKDRRLCGIETALKRRLVRKYR